MRLHVLTIFLMMTVCSAQTLQSQTCNTIRSTVDVEMNGATAVIGGLFDIRQSIFGGYACGEPNKEIMQVYEAARWALQRVNANQTVPGIKLGMKVYDTCSSDVLGLKYAQDFYTRMTSGQYSCSTQPNTIALGFLGPLYSGTSPPVAEMAGKLPVSVLSPLSMTSTLSDKTAYPYFLRTSPSALAQAKAIIAVLKELNWNRVTAVYIESIYGISGYQSMIQQALDAGICVSNAMSLPASGSVSDYAAILAGLPKFDSDVAVFFGAFLQTQKLFKALDSISATPGISDIQWVASIIDFARESYGNLAKGMLAVMPRSTLVTEFRDYFITLNELASPPENPWLANWYMTQNGCKLPGVTYAPYVSYPNCILQSINQKRDDFRQNPFVDNTIIAVYAYAKALRNAQQARCGSTPGLCLSLQQMTTSEFHQYLRDIDFQFAAADNVPSLNGKRVAFDKNGDFITEDFTVWNYNNKSGVYDFHEVGRYENGALALSKTEIRLYDNSRTTVLPNLPLFACPTSGCGQCVIPRDMVEFMYMPGDLVIGGIVSSHFAGKEPLSCGDISKEGIMTAVAFYHAIQTAKTKMSGILNGVNLGGLVVDICESSQTGKLLLNNILGELQVVRDKKGRIVNPKAINIMTEAIGSQNTIEFGESMRAFGIQEVGTLATSSSLSDKTKYPNYARVIPSDDKLSVAITQFLVRNGWTLIQTISSADNYGRTAVKDLRRAGVDGKVCIAASYEVNTDGTMIEIFRKVRQQSQARAIVMFVLLSQYSEVLAALKSLSWPNDYVLIGTDLWSDNTFVGFTEFQRGFITFRPQAFSISAFESWANSINPRDANAVPGFSEWYEYVMQCYIDAKHRGKYTTACVNSPITGSTRYAHSGLVAYTINAVYMSALALDRALRLVCGNNYNGVCSNFRANTVVSSTVKNIFRNISFTTEYGNLFKVEGMESRQGIEILNNQGSGFVKIGQFDVEQGRLSDQVNIPVTLPIGLSSATFKSVCEGRCAQCTYVYNPGTYSHIAGDIEVGGIFGIHDVSTRDPFVCGALKTVDGFQFAASVMYAVNQINSKAAPINLRDVKLGALILDHCNVRSRRFDVMSSLYSGLLPIKEGDSIDVSKVRGWITDNTVSVVEVNEVVKPLKLPLISPFATSNNLVNKDNYPTFFRTIQGDITLSVAITKLAKALNFRYVTVLYSDSEYGRGGLETFTTVSTQENVCIVYTYKIDSSTNMTQVVNAIYTSTVHVVVIWTNALHTTRFFQERARSPSFQNIVVLSPMPYMGIAQSLGTSGGKSFFLNIKSTKINGYLDFIRNLATTDSIKSDPFLMEYYMTILACDLPNNYKYGVMCSNIQSFAAWSTTIMQDNYVIPTINAVYSFAAGLDITLKEKCGSDYTKVCSNFLNTDNINAVIMQKMETITFKDPSDFNFRYIGREGNTGMDLIYYDGSTLKTVGEFAGASLQLSDNRLSSLFPVTQSACASPCTVCIKTQMDFSYIAGDILIGGVFDVHNKDVSSFSCGDIKTLHGFQLLEAFHYAINKVNDKSGRFANILKNIKLGGVGLDSCESAIKMGYTVSDIHNGIISLSKNGQNIYPDDISAYIAGYSSDSSLYLARILKSLKIPQISYASTSIALSDQDRYPYFMRSVPADDNLAESMIKFLDNFDIRYVQVVYSPNNYGKLGSMAFQNLAKDGKICIGQMIQFPDNGTATPESSNEVVSTLLEKPTANTVILFADTSYINALFQAIRRNPSAVGKYHFLGSETWGNNLEILSGVEDLAKDAVTWSLESADIGDFDTYLSTKSPGNYPENPWFPKFYEDMVDCYLTVPDGKHPVQCASLSEVVISQRNYIQDPGILHVINAVYATATGIDSALKSVCGQNYSTVCEKFQNDANRRDILLNKILEAKFNDPTGSEFMFTKKRDGNKGYQMYSLSTRMEGSKLAYYYRKIGTYSNDKTLDVNSYSPQWDGSCSRADACMECPTLRYSSKRYMYDESTDSNANAATLVALLPVHLQGSDPFRCGSLSIDNFYSGLAFFFTLQRLSPRPYSLHGLLLDTCTNSLRIDQDLYNLLSSGSLCNTPSDFGSYIINNSTVGGVVTTLSVNVMAANRVLAPLKIPLVGSLSTSVALSNNETYPYFARTIPPDNKQMRVISEILKHNNWTYVSVVYSRETYGVSAVNDLKTFSNRNGVCLGLSVPISYPTSLAEAKLVINQLIAQKDSNVVVLVTMEPRPILQAAKELGVLDKYIWIGTDSWGTSAAVVEGFEHQMMGAITVAPRVTSVSTFDEYVAELTFTNRKNIPNDWFEEFYQLIHKCRLPEAKVVMTQYPPCTKLEKITTNMLNINNEYVFTTVAATYAAASAIQQTRISRCSAIPTFRECFENTDNRVLLFQKLLETRYEVAAGFNLNFNSERYWDVGYEIYNYVMDPPGYHFYKKVGTVIADSPVTIESYNSYKTAGFMSQCPVGSLCNCDPSIFNTQPQAQTSNLTTKAKEPRNYFFYDTSITGTGQTQYTLHYTWPVWAIATAVPTCVGLLIGIFVFAYFLISYPVRGGTTVLGFMMIVGILGIYAINFAFFLPASEATCGARRFVLGVVYSIVFAALLVKAIDNWRFNDVEYNVRKYSGLTSTCSLFLTALGIVCVQIIIPVEWLILEHPSAIRQSQSEIHDWMWCNPIDKYDYALVLSMLLVIFLIILTAIFAALAWDSESNYFESRWIFVSCVCTAGCFLVWMIVSTNAGPPFRDAAVAIANFFNATALLLCLPIRKLVLLFHFQRLEEKDSQKLDEVDDRADQFSQLYSNPGFENDMFQPVERKPGSDVGF